MCSWFCLKRFEWNILYDLREDDSYGTQNGAQWLLAFMKESKKKKVLTAFRSSVGLSEFISFAYLFLFFLLCIYSHRRLSL
jgi:hypothetical protein